MTIFVPGGPSGPRGGPPMEGTVNARKFYGLGPCTVVRGEVAGPEGADPAALCYYFE